MNNRVALVAIIVVGIGAVIGLVIIFPMFLALSIGPTSRSHAPSFVVVTIPENAQEKNFDPSVVRVVIGINNTVRWVNQDSVPSSVVADDDSDPDFYNATGNASRNPTDQSLLLPGETFEFTFTKKGTFGYHSVPHPQMKGSVIVLPPPGFY
jgi:plastocyanin